MSTIGERIADLRIRRGLTQSELGEAIGETKQTIYKYEHGIVANIPLLKVEAIAKVLRCPPSALTGWEDNQIPEEDLDDADIRLLKWFRSLPPEKQRAILIAQDAPEDLL